MDLQGMMDRFLSYAWVIPCIFSILPLLIVCNGDIVGAGPDVVSTVWGMWWFQQEGLVAAQGLHSTLLNYPHGAYGVVLSPLSAVVWSLCEPIVGVGWATLLSSWIQVVLLSCGCALLARRVGLSWSVAALVPLVGTYLFFGIGEGSLVAIACAPMAFGLYFLLELAHGRWRDVLGASFCMVWMALENPYLAPFLPGMAALFWLMRAGVRSKYAVSLFVGSIGILYVAALFGAAANPDYPREVAGQQVAMFGYAWNIVELPWARMELWEFFWPEEIRWTTDAKNATEASGGRYLGLSVFVISLYGVWKHHQARMWMVLSMVGVFLSLGSVYQGFAVPFLFLNQLMDVIARPLTQPTRYLCFASVGFAMCVAYAIKDLSARSKWLVIGVLLLDGVFLGALRLRLPTTALPEFSCTQTIDGPTLVWPFDAQDGELGPSQLYQMVHEQPSVHTGIASWALPEGKRALDQVRGSGFTTEGRNIRFSRLYRLGYRWVISQKQLRGRGAKEFSCSEGTWLYRLYNR